ncbi:DUF3445 domain-containing protein [Enterovirga sp.]|uniref:heme-dependent oxidative N-demethylase family protein n=1 Tax=Enterovirga sp. TaxID=2026350 RepID=UPI0026256FAB|nr:DUF3445 domain-containing protein [Enterovirga sp.]MDB5590487.1 hypothetical protein [Enterovirga sp.]
MSDHPDGAGDRNAGTPPPPRHLPFAGATLRLGLAPIAESEWLESGPDLAAQLAAKRALLAGRREAVLRHLPGSEPACSEALAIVRDNLLRHHGKTLPEPARDGGAHPLELAAGFAAEDLCVLERGDGGYRLTAGCVCFPSNWSLAEKLGQPVAAIHGPVPDFAPTLAAPVDRVFERLAAGHIVARFNWLVHDTPDLHQVGRKPGAEPIAPEEAGERLWLRVERQTLRRLPRSGAVLFTIRTHLHRMRDAITAPDSAAALAAALRSMPPSLAAYRHMGRISPPLLVWLDRLAECQPGPA